MPLFRGYPLISRTMCADSKRMALCLHKQLLYTTRTSPWARPPVSRDGLLWKWASDIHPRFRTPWKSTAIVGLCVAFVGALVPIGDLGQLVSIGTLLAFVIVCAGVWILRVRRSELARPFKTPLVPFVPIMGMIVSLGLMAGLKAVTWIRLVVWLVIGLVIYFTYSVKHSRVRHPSA